MFVQKPSQIFKAQLRWKDQDTTFKCLSTFNFGAFADASRKAFGNILVLNDETLAPKIKKTYSPEESISLVLLPLVGSLNFNSEILINVEEILVTQITAGTSFELTNPYENELINYLQIWLKNINASTENFQNSFTFESRNELFPLYENSSCKISLGIFDSRAESNYRLSHTENGIFAFAINGAFEFENRLLEARDALSIWQIESAEFEALSENSILLLVETPLQE